MAIQKSVLISVFVTGDGTSTSLSVDLERDPYTIQGLMLAGVGNIANWLSDGRTNKPASATADGAYPNASLPSFTVSLSYPTLTLTFSSAPASGQDGQALVYLNF